MLTGCYFGRSEIKASDGGIYDIYADSRYVCSTNGDCSVTTRGVMGNVSFRAQTGDKVVGHSSVPREVTVGSILWMPFTYCLSLFLYQALPDVIVIPIDEPSAPVPYAPKWKSEEPDASVSSDDAGGSIWEKPLY